MMEASSFTLFSASFVLCGILICQPLSASMEGKLAPPLEAKTLEGTTIRMVDLRGNVVIVNFWATWCEPCREEMPALDAYYQQHKAQGLRILAISVDDEKDDALVRALAKKYSFSVAFARNANFKGYGRIWHVPLTFVVDSDGILRKDGGAGEVFRIDLSTLEQYVTPLLQKTSP
jgi:thiol-disulfide isomerase/thioredoxin